MPKVNGKSFPYTAKGKAAARKATKSAAKKKMSSIMAPRAKGGKV